MLEYGLLAGLTDSLHGGLSGVLDLAMRAGSDVLDLAVDHPWIAGAIVVLLVALVKVKPRGGR